MREDTKLRVARPSDRLAEVVRFYRDGLGFAVLGSFEGHEGFDGVMLGCPEHRYHLELTHKHGHTAGRAPTQDNLLVFYLPDPADWTRAVERMRAHGYEPVPSFNPYWDRLGKTFEDPDGYRVVLQNADWPAAKPAHDPSNGSPKDSDGRPLTAKLYGALASLWPLLSAPEDYVEEAAFYGDMLQNSGDAPARTLLELGSGGGNNASFLKARFDMTLVDLSPGMLDVSRRLNPELEHFEGDMRYVRLGRLFDRVLIHDAIGYMTTEADLRLSLQTAFVHCRPGGAALFCPDHVRETFAPATDCGGHDGLEYALRYLEWTWDPDPNDDLYTVDYTYTIRGPGGTVTVEHDRHVEGLFSRATWLRVLSEVGFVPSVVPFDHSDLEPGSYELFLGIKPVQP